LRGIYKEPRRDRKPGRRTTDGNRLHRLEDRERLRENRSEENDKITMVILKLFSEHGCIRNADIIYTTLGAILEIRK